MKQLKAVVLEKKGSRVTILASDGSFQKIRYREPVEVGAEIEITGLRQRQPLWRIMASVAAIFLFTWMGLKSWNSYQGTTAVAMISVDINPRLQLTIDQNGRVLQSEALNPDAERVLEGLELKGEPWNQALDNIIAQAVDLNYLNLGNNWVLVGYSPVKAGKETLNGVTPDDIVQKIEIATQAEGLETKIAVYQLGAEEQTQAKEQGLTLGEYALMNTAKDVGIQADASTLKSTDQRVSLLEEPQVHKMMIMENQVKEISNNLKSLTGDKGNDSGMTTPEIITTGSQPNVQPDNGAVLPSGSSQEETKQEISQGDKEPAKIEEKETGEPNTQGEQGNLEEQEKLEVPSKEVDSVTPQSNLNSDVNNQ